jgi:hypothetical protein
MFKLLAATLGVAWVVVGLRVPAGAGEFAETVRAAAATPLQPGEVDRLLSEGRGGGRDDTPPADLTGRLPGPAGREAFLADSDPAKRARLIDRLLDSEAFARHWAGYWRGVIMSRDTDAQVLLRVIRGEALEHWLFEQFKAGRDWASVTRAMITAEGTMQLTDPEKVGAAAFLLGHRGPGADEERAAETARVFLGLQLQCAQCHDHPSDVWKRTQFHELAAFYARTSEKIGRAGMSPALTLVSAPDGEHQMPVLGNPGETTTIHPRFLSDRAVPPGLGDTERRAALADAVTSTANPWFAAAYVNRAWGELMGWSFCQPVDDLGPRRDVTFPGVLARLAASFQGGGCDPKAPFRAILNSQAYQAQARPAAPSGGRAGAASPCPTVLRADVAWQALVDVLGRPPEPPSRAVPRRPSPLAISLFNRVQGFEAAFKRAFHFDPSSKPDEVQTSIPQALLLMNNPSIDERIRAKEGNLLGGLLAEYPGDGDALRALFVRVLAREPTGRERERCQAYVDRAGNRAEAFEDLLWALINSTEFQTKR